MGKKLETLTEHNKRVGDAGVACDKCGAGMNYDSDAEYWERQSVSFPPKRGRPVTCPKCGYRGRLHNGF